MPLFYKQLQYLTSRLFFTICLLPNCFFLSIPLVNFNAFWCFFICFGEGRASFFFFFFLVVRIYWVNHNFHVGFLDLTRKQWLLLCIQTAIVCACGKHTFFRNCKVVLYVLQDFYQTRPQTTWHSVEACMTNYD